MQPRDHHYAFGHIILPSMFLGNPERFLAAFQKDGEEFLEHIWLTIGKDLPKEKVLPSFGLGYDFQRTPDSTLAIIIMPPAKAMAEAMLIGCHLMKSARYFTLELGFREDESQRTVFCEWKAGGRHINFGDGPEAEIGKFSAAIREKISSPGTIN
ncbi:hypothetical protein AUK22_01900 [bacterium CG2_30_54_10]|nr:MAG: hypothetical protein AUK22_01900 [bacterium CG2_30_54_10]